MENQTTSPAVEKQTTSPVVYGPPPPFVEDSPDIWVIQLDLYFARAQIVQQEVKFQTAASLLPAHHVMEFIDMIRDPSVQAYDEFCGALRSRLGKSTEENLRSILAAQQLGDRKPSQFLRHLLELTKPHITDKDSPLVRQIFLQAMPDKSLPFLQFLPPETPLDTLAGTADRVVSSLNQASAAVDAVSSTEFLSNQDCPLARSNSARLDKISQTLDEICHQLRRISSDSRGRSTSKHHRNFRRHSVSRDRNNKLCWYHNKFGSRANKCVLPFRPRCHQIVDNSTNLTMQGGELCASMYISVCISDCGASYKALIDKYPSITASPFVKQEVSHNVTHRISTSGSPVFCRPRRLDSARLKIVKDEFQYMLDQGIIRPKILAPVHSLLVEKRRGIKDTVKWTPSAEEAFNLAKTALASATSLHHPDPTSQMGLFTDASSNSMGAVLQQWHNDPEFNQLAETSLKIVRQPVRDHDSLELICDDSTGTVRPVVPKDMRKSVFLVLHNMSHPGLSHVLLRHDGHRQGLQYTYDGPYKVLRRMDKTFTILRSGKKEIVSIDRLKPAYMENEHLQNPPDELTSLSSPLKVPELQQGQMDSSTPEPTLYRTRSGRVSKPPVRFQP
ncbi:hypothetical protein Pcinc_011128 [Petrolisthes cinctipes]|uniref:Reverse transcriptase/retrotransposon-derived protein RNase H-like domain-containing protein n=1 Tax=Petrolisthes cinctipes TaxID=88211 RepID=A0AAE1G1L2_PETCI|nr:hypothetical protein Pcinc_011128 [Petrolisthes cinctipes]